MSGLKLIINVSDIKTLPDRTFCLFYKSEIVAKDPVENDDLNLLQTISFRQILFQVFADVIELTLSTSTPFEYCFFIILL
jgi:hypothetical protein